MTILMLQTLARQGRPTGSTTNKETASLHITTGPDEVANPLEAEH